MDTTVKEHEGESVQRWTTKRKAAMVLSILKGETSIEEAARRNGLTLGEIEEWRDRFLLGAENALKIRPRDEEALKDEQIRRLKQKIGEMVLDIDIMKEAMKPYRPTTPGTLDEKNNEPSVRPGVARRLGSANMYSFAGCAIEPEHADPCQTRQ